jgi:hypothetical protein
MTTERSKGYLKAPMKDDLGGLPSRTVLSEGSLTPFAFPIAPLCR